jgi:hypothetical protein
MKEAVWAVCFVAAAAISFLFSRYWRRTNDRFFAFFSAGFACLAATNLLKLILPRGESASALYLSRLAGFVLIIVAIADKNRTPAAVVDEDDLPVPVGQPPAG